MDQNFPAALKAVLKHEGGFSNHPKDPGGATNKGITLATFRRYVDRKATVDDLKNITAQQIAEVYRRHYWNAVKADELPNGVDYAVFDYAVNSGPTRAAKHLQEVVGVAMDGKIGPVTLAAVKRTGPSIVIVKLCTRRMKFLRGLDTWPTFGKGWTNRVTDVEATALLMARPAAQPAQDAVNAQREAAKNPPPFTPQNSTPAPKPAPRPAPAPVAPNLSAIIAAFVVTAVGALAWFGDLPCNILGVLCQ